MIGRSKNSKCVRQPGILGTSLDKEKIREQLQAPGFILHYVEDVDSTNDWAKREGKEGAPDLSVYLADHQSAGKGRRGRVWKSPYGTSISMSLLLRPRVPMERVHMLTLVMGLAAALGMQEVSDLTVSIKWPNDVVTGGKKLCGILTEMSSAADYVVIGIGMNVNVEEFPEEIASMATSLKIEKGVAVSREAVTASVLNHFYDLYKDFLQTADLSLLKETYEKLLANKGALVRVLDPQAPFEGTALGITPFGELLVERADTGVMEKVYAGEVSVRGIYGYI